MELFIKVNSRKNLFITKDGKDGKILYTLHDLRNGRSIVLLDEDDYKIYTPDVAKAANAVASQNLFIHMAYTDFDLLLELISDCIKVEEQRRSKHESENTTEHLKELRRQSYECVMKEIKECEELIREKQNYFLSCINSHESEYDWDNLKLQKK